MGEALVGEPAGLGVDLVLLVPQVHVVPQLVQVLVDVPVGGTVAGELVVGEDGLLSERADAGAVDEHVLERQVGVVHVGHRDRVDVEREQVDGPERRANPDQLRVLLRRPPLRELPLLVHDGFKEADGALVELPDHLDGRRAEGDELADPRRRVPAEPGVFFEEVREQALDGVDTFFEHLAAGAHLPRRIGREEVPLDPLDVVLDDAAADRDEGLGAALVRLLVAGAGPEAVVAEPGLAEGVPVRADALHERDQLLLDLLSDGGIAGQVRVEELRGHQPSNRQ